MDEKQVECALLPPFCMNGISQEDDCLPCEVMMW